MLEFKRRVLKFSLDDVDYNLNYPTVKQVAEYSREYSESTDQIETVINFLDGLGLGREVCEGMEMPHLNQILEKLTEEKK